MVSMLLVHSQATNRCLWAIHCMFILALADVHRTSVSEPMDVPCTSVERPDLALPYIYCDVRNWMYFEHSVQIYRITDVLLTRKSICSYVKYYISQHQRTAEQTSMHAHGKPASHILLAVLNSCIPFHKEIIIVVGEGLHKSHKRCWEL